MMTIVLASGRAITWVIVYAVGLKVQAAIEIVIPCHGLYVYNHGDEL